MSGSLIKIIDSSLLPITVLVFVKLAGVYLVAWIFGIDMAIVPEIRSIISISPLAATTDVVILTSYSDVLMFSAIAIGLSLNVFNALYLHDSHIDIKTVNQLANFNLMTMIKSSSEIYHNALSWLLFAWLAVAVIAINVAAGKTFLWVLLCATIFCLMLSVALFRDILQEIDLTRKKFKFRALE